MKKAVLVVILGCLCLAISGCEIAGVMASPSDSETYIEPEYDLAAHKPQKVLVLVDQAAGLQTKINVRRYLTLENHAYLTDKVGLKANVLVPFEDMEAFRQKTPNYLEMTPAEVGKALGADMVLYIAIDDFGLYGLGAEGYYKANLDTRSGLYDVNSGKKVWPATKELKTVKVAVEVMNGGQEAAATRLAQASARCIERNFYECPRAMARVQEEVKDVGEEGINGF